MEFNNGSFMSPEMFLETCDDIPEVSPSSLYYLLSSFLFKFLMIIVFLFAFFNRRYANDWLDISLMTHVCPIEKEQHILTDGISTRVTKVELPSSLKEVLAMWDYFRVTNEDSLENYPDHIPRLEETFDKNVFETSRIIDDRMKKALLEIFSNMVKLDNNFCSVIFYDHETGITLEIMKACTDFLILPYTTQLTSVKSCLSLKMYTGDIPEPHDVIKNARRDSPCLSFTRVTYRDTPLAIRDIFSCIWFLRKLIDIGKKCKKMLN